MSPARYRPGFRSVSARLAVSLSMDIGPLFDRDSTPTVQPQSSPGLERDRAGPARTPEVAIFPIIKIRNQLARTDADRYGPIPSFRHTEHEQVVPRAHLISRVRHLNPDAAPAVPVPDRHVPAAVDHRWRRATWWRRVPRRAPRWRRSRSRSRARAPSWSKAGANWSHGEGVRSPPPGSGRDHQRLPATACDAWKPWAIRNGHKGRQAIRTQPRLP